MVHRDELKIVIAAPYDLDREAELLRAARWDDQSGRCLVVKSAASRTPGLHLDSVIVPIVDGRVDHKAVTRIAPHAAVTGSVRLVRVTTGISMWWTDRLVPHHSVRRSPVDSQRFRPARERGNCHLDLPTDYAAQAYRRH